MPEPGPYNKEYTQHHPDAIANRDKAEMMARASKEYEETVVEKANMIIDQADNYNALRKGDEFGDRPTGPAVQIAKEAEAARMQADQASQRAADIYDYAEKLKKGKNPSFTEVGNEEDAES